MTNRLLSAITILILGISTLLQAQITISAQDILNTIGTSIETEIDTTGNISVNPGSPGENQIWDFTSLSINGYIIPTEYITPDGTPFASDFPGANFVQKTVYVEGDVNAEMYVYENIQPTKFSHLGNGIISGEFRLMQTGGEVADLPLTYGAEWTENVADTILVVDGFFMETISISNSSVDGWGLLKLPIGDFESLRIRDDFLSVSNTYVSNILVSSDTTNSIEYSWVAREAISLMYISSEMDDTNPNFNTAGEIGWATSISTSDVTDDFVYDLPVEFVLEQNYPNPFNPETVISYSLPKQSTVVLSVYDVTGRLVDTITPGLQQAGTHEVRWQAASHLASGAYIYRIQAGNFVSTKKMILIR